MPTVYTYAPYTLVDQREEYEYRKVYNFVGGFYVQNKRRAVTTMTWEATLTDNWSDSPSAYQHDQGWPGSVNPGNLSSGDGWKLYAVEYSRGLSQPMSKVVRETWVRTGTWETLPDD